MAEQAVESVPLGMQTPSTPIELLDGVAHRVPDIAIATSEDDDKALGRRVLAAAQVLHTEVYIEKEFIEADDPRIDITGTFIDEYVKDSKYYYVRNGAKVASARQIRATKKDGLMSLPTTKHFTIDPEELRKTAEVDSLADVKHDEVVEISGLASRKYVGADGRVHKSAGLDAVIALYSTMICDSLERGHKLWLMNTDAPLLRNFSFLIGEEQIHRLGDAQEYMGPPSIPAAINPTATVRAVLSEPKKYELAYGYLKEILKGADSKKIPQDIQDLMVANGIEFKRTSKLRQHFSEKEIAFHGVVLAYSAARAFPVANIDQFHGDVATLWGIDVATSFPYSYGLAKMYAGKNVAQKAIGASIAVPNFLAPYAYLYAEGKDYPPVVNGIVTAMVGTAAILEMHKRRSRSKKHEKLAAMMQAPKGEQQPEPKVQHDSPRRVRHGKHVRRPRTSQ